MRFLFISCCFFFFFTNPVDIENARVKLAFTIPSVATITVANDAIEMLPIVADKTINKIIKSSNIFTNALTH